MPEVSAAQTAETIEARKRIVCQLFEEAFNRGDLATVDKLWIPGNLEEGKRAIVNLRTAFPDYHRTIEAQVAEGDLIVTRWTARGTHRGPFRSGVLGRTVAATGATFETPGISMHRIADGRVTEAWVLGNDSATLLAQLGALSTRTP
jgi:predicted ester cyclase